MTEKMQQPKGGSHNANHNRTRRSLLFQAVNGRCFYCGSPISEEGLHQSRDWLILKDARLVIEHKLPTIRGGDDHPDNITGACRDCNSRKGTFTVDEFRLVEALRRGDLNFRFAGEQAVSVARDWIVCHSADDERAMVVHNLPSAAEAYLLRRNSIQRGRAARAGGDRT